jgi:phage/plasmid primase-like uncharacterized protein
MKKATPLQSRQTNDAKHNTKDLAQGNWVTILARFGADASCLDGKHRPCPSCGGTDRFRFDDRDGQAHIYAVSVGQVMALHWFKRWAVILISKKQHRLLIL